ncbi:MAG: platelet-activating factor acetylhydrolase IB subunit [Pseudomonadota bacterium]
MIKIFILVLIAIAGVWFFYKKSSAFEPMFERQQGESAVAPVPREVEKWWMERHQEKLVQKAHEDQIDLVMIGDSITQRWETNGRAAWAKYYSHRNSLNLGFDGDRTENVLWRLENGAVDGLSPKLVILMIGTNNTGHLMDEAADTADGIKKILDFLQNKLPMSKILLLGIFPRGFEAGDQQRARNDEVNQIISGFSDEQNIWYLDISKSFLSANGGVSKKIMRDGLHLKRVGYEIWAESMEPMVSRLMQ